MITTAEKPATEETTALEIGGRVFLKTGEKLVAIDLIRSIDLNDDGGVTFILTGEEGLVAFKGRAR